MDRRGWFKYGAGVVACLALAYFPFVRVTRVPLLGGVDLGFHELGHLLTYWLPDTFTALMGSVTQVAVPLGLAAYFGIRRRDPLGAGLCLTWAGTAAYDVSVYIADAPTQLLPLIGGEHDWAFLLASWNVLGRAAEIATVVRVAGGLMAISGIVVCAAGPWLDARREQAVTAAPPSAPSEGWAIIPPWEQGSAQGGAP